MITKEATARHLIGLKYDATVKDGVSYHPDRQTAQTGPERPPEKRAPGGRLSRIVGMETERGDVLTGKIGQTQLVSWVGSAERLRSEGYQTSEYYNELELKGVTSVSRDISCSKRCRTCGN